MYYHLTAGDEKQKSRVDGVIAQSISRWNRTLMRAAQKNIAVPREPTGSRRTTKRRRLPEPPPGWGSAENATRANLLAAQSLRQSAR